MTASTASRALACALLALLSAGATCNTAARSHPLTLEPEVYDFHEAIRRGEIERAARHLDEDKQQAFIQAWGPARKKLEVHDMDVLSIQKNPDATFAQVEAQLSYALVGTLEQRQYTLRTLWKGEGTGWTIDGTLEPPPELRPAPPEPATPAAAPASPGYSPPAAEPTGDGFGGGG